LLPFVLRIGGTHGKVQNTAQARVVRLMTEKSSKWRLSINTLGEGAIVSSSFLTNELTRLHLHQGDLILLGSFPKDSGPSASTWNWLARCCESNNVAVYFYGVYAPKLAAKLFHIPIYNWSAPYGDPMNLKEASFFYDGRFLGYSTNGFQVMLEDIRHKHPSKVFILGSLYDTFSQFGPCPVPYEHQRNHLEAALKDTDTSYTELDAMLGAIWATSRKNP
jgi:hypothetical protein